MNTKYFALLLSIILLSCKSEIKKTNPIVSEVVETTIQQLSSPANSYSSLPRLYGKGKKLLMSWVEKQDTVAILKYASFKNDAWSVPVEINRGTDWFVNWADYPAIAENNGNILTNILQKSANGKYTYDIKLDLFSKETNNWNNNFLLNLDGKKSEHGFVSILPIEEDSF